MRRIDVRGLTGRALGEALAPAVAHLEADRLMALPTATVYGFSGAVTAAAVAKLARLKGRDPAHPFLLLIPDEDPLDAAVWTPAARALADAFWPGPLTLVLHDAGPELPAAVRSRSGGLAVRRCAHPVVRALLARFGQPITSTSANDRGGVPAHDAAGCAAAWRRLGGRPEEGLIIDAGPLPPSPPTTIVDCRGSAPVLLREGAVPSARLRAVVGELVSNPDLQ